MNKSVLLVWGCFVVGTTIAAIWLLSTLLQPVHGSINIAATDYNSALAEWHSQQISRYEMVVENDGEGPCIGCGTYTLRVIGNQLSVLGYISPTLSVYTVRDEETPKELTIEKLFERIDSLLRERPFECEFEAPQFVFYYTIKFDPRLGYPQYIEKRSSGGTRHCGGLHHIKVKSLQIIK